MADGTDGGFGGSIHGSDDEPYQTPEAQVYALANKIKRMVDEEYHFVFFWGMPQAGKTHILYTIWLCLEQLGSVVDNEGDKATVRRQKAFRFALDEFCKCKPGKGTLLPDIFEITAVFSPKIAIKGSFPAIKFAFIEASGEITARQHTMDKMLGGQELDFPPLHNAILSEENAKVLHVLVPAYQLGQSFKDQQDANLNEVLSLLEKKRPRVRQTDEKILVIAKWDEALRSANDPNPLEWARKNVPRTIAKYQNFSIREDINTYYQTYATGTWAIGTSDDGRSVPYAQIIDYKSAECLVHWLYRAATGGKLIFPEKEPPLPPPVLSSKALLLAKIRRFFGMS